MRLTSGNMFAVGRGLRTVACRPIVNIISINGTMPTRMTLASARKDMTLDQTDVQPQGYSSTDAAQPPLPADSPKLQQWQDLRKNLARQMRVRTFVGHTTQPEYTDVKGKLVDALLVPTSPPVYRWFHDEMWTVKVRLQKDDGSISELVIDRTTQLEYVD
jgi:hypothetical protein